MRYLPILFFLALASCGKKEEVIEEQIIDSLFVKSDSLFNQAIVTLPKSDKQFTKMVEKVEKKIETLKVEVIVAKKAVELAKAEKTIVYIRDTIFIKEEKNFWGKKKVTIDSVGLDSLKN
jgi:predicted amino acid-binding ACT domain protein